MAKPSLDSPGRMAERELLRSVFTDMQVGGTMQLLYSSNRSWLYSGVTMSACRGRTWYWPPSHYPEAMGVITDLAITGPRAKQRLGASISRWHEHSCNTRRPI